MRVVVRRQPSRYIRPVYAATGKRLNKSELLASSYRNNLPFARVKSTYLTPGYGIDPYFVLTAADLTTSAIGFTVPKYGRF